MEILTNYDDADLFTDVIINDEIDFAYGDLKTAVGRSHPTVVTAPPKPLVIAGPPGSNKAVVFEELLKEFPDKFGFPLASTTREPEDGEIDGVHYAFVPRETFDADVDAGKFVECTEVIVGYGEWAGEDVGNPPITVMYGTPARELKRIGLEGKMPVMETDAAGAAAMRAAGLDAVFVFFSHPEHDPATHRENITAQTGETDAETLEERVDEAIAELAAARGIVQVTEGVGRGKTKPVFRDVLAYEAHAARYARFKEAIASEVPSVVPMHTVWGFGRPRWGRERPRVRTQAPPRCGHRPRGVRQNHRRAPTRRGARRAAHLPRSPASPGCVRRPDRAR